ncbi:hypothetical protein EMCRGX_G020082 [Ephydatia muelleri]
MMALASRLCLVTGGGSGIGRAVCRLFAKEGACVAVVGNSEEEVNSTTQILHDSSEIGGATYKGYRADVTSAAQVAALMDAIKADFAGGPALSVLVNSAGITRDSLLLKQTEEEFDSVLAVNLKGTFLMTQAVARQMLNSKGTGGSIVNISSIVGKIGNVGQANYSASKGGVMAMTLTCARELGRYGIRCNAVLPGFIATPMTAKVPDKVIQQVIKSTSLGRMGKPEEVAEVCLFLASEKSSFVTGACIEVTGGL